MKRVLLTSSCLGFSIFATAILAQNFEFVADYVRYDQPREWVSVQGGIEIKTEFGYFYPSRVEYDIQNEHIFVDGEFRGVLPTGERVIADYADLNFQTQAAILRSVKVMLASGMEGAAQYASYDGEIAYGENIIASTCTVCSLNPTPIWQLRAEQAMLNETTQKIYIRNGYFDLFGVPIGWVPHLRIAAPDAGAMEGFLPLQFDASTGDNSGVTLRYFQPMGAQTDMTASLFVSATDFQIPQIEFRHNGRGFEYRADGKYILSGDDAQNGDYYLLQKLAFRLPYGWNGQARHLLVSDYDVPSDYDFTDPKSDYLYVNKFTNDYWLHAELIDYIPSSVSVENDEFPTVLPHIYGQFSNVIYPGVQFNSDIDFLHLNQDLGEDVTRLSSKMDITSTNIFPLGVLAKSKAGIMGNIYDIEGRMEADQNGMAMRLTPFASLDLQMPFVSSTDQADYILTPRMMMAWSENYDSGVGLPNVDSLYVEHDFVSLFSENHFTGRDQFEGGFRGSLGLSYTMITQANQNFEMGLGRIWRSDDLLDNENESYSILSDWVGYLNYSLNDQISLYTRWAFDNNFDFSRSEIEFNYKDKLSKVSLEWVRLAPEPEIGFDDVRSEVLLDGSYQFAPNWEIGYDLRYDLVQAEPFDAKLALTYGNECIEVEAGTSWDFTGNNATSPEISFDLNVEFFGLSADRKDKWAKRTCQTTSNLY